MNLDGAPLPRELDRVGQEVPYHLLYAVAIAPDPPLWRIKRRFQVDAEGFYRWTHHFDCSFDNRQQIGRLPIEIQFASCYTRDVQKVFNNASLRPRISLDHVQRGL